MKDQQPDKLFRDKLANYQKAVPSSAWNRIESAVERKAFPAFRVAVAASLLLICGVAVTLWLRNDVNPGVVAAKEQPETAKPKTNKTPVIEEPKEDERTLTPESIDDRPRTTPSDASVIRQSTPAPAVASKDDKERRDSSLPQMITEPDVTQAPAIAQNENLSEEAVVSEELPVVEDRLPANDLAVAVNELEPVQTDTDESVTIIISAEETSAYLTKNIKSEATPEEKKSSTLKKVLKKASALKNNDQDPIGDLRQMKDELLALNFKSDKRGQNK